MRNATTLNDSGELSEEPSEEEKLRELKSSALDAISSARRSILMKYPFIGSIALRMEMVPVRDVRVSTACTDGSSVYFDISFLSELSQAEREFVLAHEIWHAVLLHLVRCGSRDYSLFNIAADKEVNWMLKQDGMTPPPQVLFPTKEEQGKCAEEIYEMLLASQQAGDGQDTQNRMHRHGNSCSMPGSCSKSIPSASKLSGQFDKHVFEEDGSQEPSEDHKASDKYGKIGFDRDFKPSVPKDFADKMRETVISEAQRAEKLHGTIPAHIKQLVEDFCTPEVNWEEALAQFVTSRCGTSESAWIPPNRRYVCRNLYLPSRRTPSVKLAVGIDTSGSTLQDQKKFLSELQSLVKTFGNYEIHLIECDAEVQNYKLWTQDDDLEHVLESGYETSGGGGTELTPIYDYILDNHLECDAVVVMTDGYIEHIHQNPIPSIPTLWIITRDGTEDFCTWGQKVKFKQHD